MLELSHVIVFSVNNNLFLVPSPSGYFAPGSGPIWGTQINCTELLSQTGSDLSPPGLLDCHWTHPIGEIPNCDHSQDAGVFCG